MTNTYGTFFTPDLAINAGTGTDTVKLANPGTGGFLFDLSAGNTFVENIDLSQNGLSDPPLYPQPLPDPNDPDAYVPPAPRPNLLIGGPGKNIIRGDAGPDTILPKGGGDVVYGGGYDDTIVSSGDYVRDVVSCGAGTQDTVTAEWIDTIWSDCEHTTRTKFAGL